jgi:hypothetical protein
VAEASAPRAEVCFPPALIVVTCISMQQVCFRPEMSLFVFPGLDPRSALHLHSSTLRLFAKASYSILPVLHCSRRSLRRACWQRSQGGHAQHKCCWQLTRRVSSVHSSSCSSRRIQVRQDEAHVGRSKTFSNNLDPRPHRACEVSHPQQCGFHVSRMVPKLLCQSV